MANRVEDPLLRRSNALRETAASYTPYVNRRLRSLSEAGLNAEISKARGDLNADMAAQLAAPPTGSVNALQGMLARGKALSLAATQGEGQMRMADLLTRPGG